ncbi:disulfide bond formation protein DsbA [Aliifodinibius salipaludis]|uniref:Disulfide bond formation protein DsbA n=1 Tax=Fodinibius salipaludis TaxID=2032627 RepID=A0A2A2GAN2_9BACT|nr:DsbA family oxidoreductase [Aliifodinibius salipaludis]PAU93909.1 disulfide bond formation protein DsbA [Aliifodinibius salipaludis]
MKVEIWSDVMCPFCYIGKRRFENALKNFEYADEVKIKWRSFQLNPDMETDPNANINEYLAKAKGWSLEQAQQMNQRVTDMAADEGLEYNMDQAVVANSYDAHRLAQFSKDRGKADEMEEALFNAYFTDGKNIADHQTLIGLAKDIGIDPTEAQSILESDKYANAVDHDIQLAQNINITGVPFFLFDQKFGVSGARETEVFLKALKQSWNAQLQEKPRE